MLSDEERIEQLELEVKVLRANNKGLKDKIDEQSKEIEDNKKYIDLHYVPYEQYISKLNELNKKWKDAIKAKIEEIDKQEKEVLKGTKGQDRYAIKQEYMHKRSVLQSLLEKE